jgi:membrane protein YqaA with SNARE-associated domain
MVIRRSSMVTGQLQRLTAVLQWVIGQIQRLSTVLQWVTGQLQRLTAVLQWVIGQIQWSSFVLQWVTRASSVVTAVSSTGSYPTTKDISPILS